MKLKQYQAGGAIYTPFISSRGQTQTQTQVEGSSDSKSKKGEISGIQKEIVKVLSESGIQSDVDTFLMQANDFLKRSQNLSSAYLFGGESQDYSMSDLITVLSMANKVKQNKLQHTEAIDRLDNQDAWNEVAVTTTGQVYVYEKDKGLKTISAEEYYDNKDKKIYQALTNSQVLGFREQDPNLAFNGTFKSDILKDVSSAIGMKSVETELLNIVDKFGSVTRSEYIQNTGEPVSKSVYDGMQLLIGKGPEGYYKVTTKSERENIDSALKYLWSTIGTDGQAKLRAEAAINGNDPNKNHYDLILQVFKHHTDYSQTPDFDSSATKHAEEKNKSEALTPESRTEMIARGYGIREKIEIVPRVDSPDKPQAAITTDAINFGQLLDKQGDMLDGLMSLREVLKQDPAFRAQTDAKNITFGNIHLKQGDLDKIVVDTNWNNLSGIYLPYKEDGAGVVPDFSMIDNYNFVEQKLRENPHMIAAEVQKLLKSKGIDPSKVERVQINGQYVYKLKTQYFLTFSAYGNNDTLKAIRDNTRYFEHLGEEGGVWMRKDALSQFNPDVFNDVTKYGKINHGKKATPVVENSFWKADDWDADNAYMGNIFVAVDPARALYATEHKLTERAVFEDPIERIQITQNAQNPRMKANFDE